MSIKKICAGDRVFVLGDRQAGVVEFVRQGFASRKVDLSVVRVRLDNGDSVDARKINVVVLAEAR